MSERLPMSMRCMPSCTMLPGSCALGPVSKLTPGHAGCRCWSGPGDWRSQLRVPAVGEKEEGRKRQTGCTSWLEASGGWPLSSPSEPADFWRCMLLRMPLIPEALLAGESLSELSFSEPAMDALPAPGTRQSAQGPEPASVLMQEPAPKTAIASRKLQVCSTNRRTEGHAGGYKQAWRT